MSENQKSYSRIIKSSSTIGGAQGINMLIGMIRVKFIAILIGPIGVGLITTYQSILQLVGTVAGAGLQSSAVRDIAQAQGKEDLDHLGRIVLSLRRMCLLTGLLGTVSVSLFSRTISQITFNNSEHTFGIIFVGLTILFTNLKGAQIALLQGMRRIADLAKLNVIGAISGTIISIGLYFLFGIDGIVPAIVMLSLSELIASWWFARKINIPKVSMTWSESFQAAGGMIRMGLAFMWNSLLIAIVAYLTRLLIAQDLDLVAVGIFSAAFALSGLVVNFILGAMGADYYPSLTAISTDNRKMRELVNQQTEIGLLLSVPGLFAILVFSPWIIKLFYTSEFYQSADLLRWFAIGCIGRVISWPLGFIILAKGLSRLFVVTETIINLIHLLLIVSMLSSFGIAGVAFAYPILYILHIFMMLMVSRYLIGFSWSVSVWKIVLLSTALILLSLLLNYLLVEVYYFVFGLLLTGLSAFFCLKSLIFKLGSEHRLYIKLSRMPFVKIIFK